ncbi:MAG: DUF502 domain-containing protein [Planctomycetes bacterium]|nr:DUF502 domain-containing protein [Planctomycetota bacterium]
MRKLGKIFLQGLAAVLPLALTIYVLWWLGTTAERLFGPVIRRVLPGDAYVPGLGVAVGLGLVFAIGLVLRAWWVRSLWNAFEELFERIPLVKTIYGAVKDMMSFFGGDERRQQLDQVVMLRWGDPPVQLLGLVTNEDARKVTGRDADEGQVAVYLPMSYQIGGFTLLVPRSAVTATELSVEEGMRFAMTAGVRSMPARD